MSIRLYLPTAIECNFIHRNSGLHIDTHTNTKNSEIDGVRGGEKEKHAALVFVHFQFATRSKWSCQTMATDFGIRILSQPECV